MSLRRRAASVGVMQQRGFSQGVEVIMQNDPPYPRSAYYFLREALDFTVARHGGDERSGSRHVSGQQLAAGFRDHALGQFGPMAAVVMEQWGVTKSEDVGVMVTQLIAIGVFGRSEDDRFSDFLDLWDLNEAFVLPYLPPSARPKPAAKRGRGTKRLPAK